MRYNMFIERNGGVDGRKSNAACYERFSVHCRDIAAMPSDCKQPVCTAQYRGIRRAAEGAQHSGDELMIIFKQFKY